MMIETPAVTDVLCGKDKTFAKHPGNLLYRNLIHATAAAYAGTPTKQDKMKMTTEIVNTMLNSHGSRFLKCVAAGSWEEISVTAARDKTSHALRFCAAHTIRTHVPTTHTSKRRSSRAAAAAAAKQTRGKKLHRRTVSSETTSAIIHRIGSFPKDSDCYAPEQVTSAASVVVVVHRLGRSAVKAIPVSPVPCEEDLEAILREPLRWEDVDDGDGFFLL
jgi:hypothetical protein